MGEKAIEIQKSNKYQQEISRHQYYPYTKMPCRVEDERRMNWTCPGFEKNSIPLCCSPCLDEKSIFYFNQTYCCTFNSKSDPCPDLSHSFRLKVYLFLTIAVFLAALGATCINSHRLFIEKRELVDKAKRQEAA